MIVECNCILVDRRLKEMDIDDEGVQSPFIFLMSEVASCRGLLNKQGELTLESTVIELKYGDSTNIDIPFKEFIKQFKQYNNERIPSSSKS